jgi:hypothetical protein
MAVGIGVGLVLGAAWWKRHWIASMVRRVAHPLSAARSGLSLDTAPANAIRHIRRYTFAAMQDKSPIVGLTHASYALMGLDLLEETVGREAIQSAGYDPSEVRAMITKLQDKHAEALRSADPYISEVLALERREGAQLPGFVMAGPAPMGA